MNFIIRIFQSVTRTCNGVVATFTAICAGAPMLAAAPAFADHNQVQVVVSNGGFTFGLRSGPAVQCLPPVQCVPADTWATREFERGQCAGRNDGVREGFSDGLRDCFDLRIRTDFCRMSRPFEGGYRNTYKQAYSDAFQRGRCERLARIERERCERERFERERQCHVEWNHGRGWGPPWSR